MPATKHATTLALTTALLSPTALATNYTWLSSVDNDFDNVAVWSPGGYPDDASDQARFTAAGTAGAAFDVQFNNDETNDSLIHALSFPRLILWRTISVFEYAYTYTLNTSSGPSMNITGVPGGAEPSLFVDGRFLDGERSSIEASSSLHLASADNTRGTLTLNGADWNSNSFAQIGLEGTGTLRINENATMTNSTGIIGQNPGSAGTVHVYGESFGGTGTWNNTADLLVGWFGSGTLNNNGTTTNRNALVAADPGSTGTVNMPRGSWTSTDSLYVGGDALGQGGSGTINHNNGVITVQDSVTIWGTGEFFNNDGTLNITNDLTLKPNATMTVTGPGFGPTIGAEVIVGGHTQLGNDSTLTIDDPGSELSTGSIAGGPGTLDWTKGTISVTNGDFSVDPAGPTSSFLVINTDMALNVSDTLRVGTTAGAGLFIVNMAQVTTGNLEIANTPASTSAVSVSVAGDGTTLDVTSDITLGNNAAAGGQLVITDAGLVNSHNTFASPSPSQHAEILVRRLVAATPTAQWHSVGSVYLGGTETTLGGTAKMDILDGGLATIAGTLRVWDDATLTQDLGSLTTPVLHHSGTFNHTGPLDLTGAGPIGALILDGGTINAPSIDFANVDLTGHGTLNAKTTNHGTITATGPLTVGIPTDFTALSLTGPLNVGAHTVTLHQAGFFNIGPFTTIDGGTLAVPNGAALPVGTAIVAHGNIDARLVQIAGSTIFADGPLTIGDATAADGYFSDGILNVNGHTVTIHDANEAVLGSLTTIGETVTPGILAAPNGLLVEFGKNVTGHGTIDTPNDPVKPLINNGHIEGDSPLEPITLNGYVKGVGSFANIVVNGTLSPGLSPGVVYVDGDLTLGEEAGLLIELAGLVVGVEHDQLNIAGSLHAAGTLRVELLEGYHPRLDDAFKVLSVGGVSGGFDRIELPVLGHGLVFDASSVLTTGRLVVVPEPGVGGVVLVLGAGAVLLRGRG